MDSEKKDLMFKTYRQFMEIGLGDGDPDLLPQIADEKIVGFGTAIDEKILGLDQVKQLLQIQKEQSKGFELSWRSVPVSHYTSDDEQTAVFADDLYLTIKAGQESIDMYLRFSVVLNYVDGRWKVIHWHGSKPEQVESDKDTWGLDVWKQKAEELEQLVAEKTADLLHKNRELQIESSLEKVRTVAMGMKASEDMLSICQVIAQQLEGLGLAHIRNVQTAIFYPDRGTYMNYEYYAKHDKTLVTEVDYRNHPIQQSFADKMMTGPGEEVREHLSGQKMRDWHAFQQTTNQFVDDYILSAESLNYYWFSLGPVALGTSTYTPLSLQEIDLFKRFIKVFELAYQRYLDIEKALAQAKEAQTELALERIRAKVTAMMESKDLLDIVVSMRQEFVALGHEAHYFWYMRWLPDKYEKAMTSGDGTRIGMMMTLPRHLHGDIPLLDNWEKGSEPAVVYPMNVDEAIAYVDKMVRIGNFTLVDPQAPTEDDLRHINGLTFVMARTNHGEIGYSLPGVVHNPPSDDINTLVRFAGVFDLAYRRFEDLQEAEKRNRETQIELSLERVRAKAMAMHNSADLPATASTAFSELKKLGFTPIRTGISIQNRENRKNLLYSATSSDSGENLTLVGWAILDHHPVLREVYDKWYIGEDCFPELHGETLRSYYEQVRCSFDVPVEQTEIDQYGYFMHFTFGLFYGWCRQPVTEEEKKLLRRFTAVIDLTFKRYFDLQKAESQAREAEIELALERVRARTMAMQHSAELADASAVLDQQVRALGIETWGCAFHIYADDPDGDHEWFSGREGNLPFYKTPRENFFLDFYEKGKAGETFHLQEFLGEDCKIHYDYLMTLPAVGDSLRNIVQSGGSLPESQYDHIAFFKYGYVLFITYKPVPEAIEIFKRFAKVFEQTYTRFLDLKKAEAQAREAHVELSLERIRAQVTSMQNSSDLFDIVVSMRKEFISLGHEADYFWHMLWGPDNYELSMTSEDGSRLGMVINVPKFVHREIPSLYAWENSNSPYFVLALDGEHAWDYVDKMNTYGSFQQIDPHAPTKEDILHIGGLTFIIARTTHGEIGFSLAGEVPDPPKESLETLVRFAGVFDLAYKRFMDLQKAEAQAREAQIEAALERVRSRTMAMHKSSELHSAAELLFDQVRQLGAELQGVAFAICDKDSVMIQKWTSIGIFSHPYTIEPVEERMYEAWKNQAEMHEEVIEGERQRKYYEAFMEIPEFRQGLQKFIDSGFPMPTWQKNHAVPFRYGYLLFITTKPFAETQIFLRFGKVFDQTYTRFLDLQKAEAQAREAQIEAALERVRSRSIGMQKSDELKDVIQVVYDQMAQLNLPVEHTGFILDYKTRNDYPSWIADHLGSPSHIVIPYFEATYYDRFNQAKREGAAFFAVNLDFDEKNRFYQDLFRHLPGFPEDSKQFILEKPALTISTVLLDDVALYIENFSGMPFSEQENSILMRFGKVFQQTYTRFLDLQKAEAQAREAQIEAALERVRARAMAMHASTELGEVVQELRKQMGILGQQDLETCVIHLHDESPDYIQSWAGIKPPELEGGILEARADVPKKGLMIIEEALTAYQENQQDYVILNEGDKLRQWFSFLEMASPDGFARLIEPVHGQIEELRAYWSFADFKGGSLLMVTRDKPGENSRQLLRRFANVFGLAYRRFTDIKNAEARAREAQIEAALERVRSKTMAMHNSQDVGESVATLFEELVGLGVLHPEERCGIGIMLPDQQMEAWTAAKIADGKAELTIGLLDMTLHPLLASAYNGWVNKKDINQYILEGEDRRSYYEAMLTQPSYKITRDHYTGHIRIYHNDFYFKEGCLYVFAEQELPEASLTVYTRFAAVFGQTYRRYQDLLKAEAQAREAQIEAALESIRSKAMAMRNSDDISETTAASFAELKKLGISSFRSGVGILTKGSRMAQVFADTRAEDGQLKALSTLRSMDEHPALQQQYRAWEKQEDYEQFLSGDELTTYYSHPFFQKSNIDLEKKEENHQECGYYFAFPDGLFYSWSYQPYTEAEKSILRRFRNIISLTFRRYLDLQKAEAQAREAQIEAALEKVRSRTMAMQKPEELADTAHVLFEQLKGLGVSHERINIGIVQEAEGKIDFWVTEQGGNLLKNRFIGRISEPTTLFKVYQAWKAGSKSLVVDLQGEELDSWIKFLRSEVHIPFETAVKPTRRVQTAAMFSKGMLILSNPVPLSEEAIQLLERFAGVFDLTYTRFNDLKTAEAQAREATKQASLDRVRAVIASMRSTEDLELITPLMFKELTTLGVPFIRCGVFIIHEERQIIDAYLSSPSGASLGVLHLPYQASELTMQTVEAWRNGRVHRQHWSQADFIAWTKQMMEQHQIENSRSYQGSDTAPESLDLHFVPFDQGMLYVGSLHPLGDDELELVLALAKSFSIAYARYEDFVKLEAAKANIESTLTELKSTQAQLIQQEKLASLGQLTAGIAHEIQNPLNFVNNFSEINAELSEEMLEAIDKGDLEEARALATDMKANQEKIRDHGKRADSIVKGMLQHSRSSAGAKEPTNISSLADEYLRLSYHGMRAKDKSFNATIKTDFDPELPLVPVVAQDIGRVLLNLFNNAFYAVNERKKMEVDGYEPEVVVHCGWAYSTDPSLPSTAIGQLPTANPAVAGLRYAQQKTAILISVRDNGTGIPESIKEKIFQPFFTTKPTGQGTGLGLSLSYDIIKAHGGTLELVDNSDRGTTFHLQLPLGTT